MIRLIQQKDKDEYIQMATDFYESDAVCHNIDKQNILNAFDEYLNNSPYTECYILEEENKIIGYGMIAKTFSQEAGGIVVWIEELYLKQEYRSLGKGSQFFEFIYNKYKDNVKRIRLEVEKDNKRALKLYKKIGYEPLEYKQMIMDL